MVEPRDLALIYMAFKESVVAAGFAAEIDWQADLDFECVSETDFLREAAWVILTSGFSESIVRGRFPAVSRAFHFWCSAAHIAAHRQHCERSALDVFGNRRKIRAILSIVEGVARNGFPTIKAELRVRKIQFLRELPYIGPVTAYHLGKNLGLDVVKPDRHLVRMAHKTGYECPRAMCSAVADIVGDPISVIDIVFWRYATLNREYEHRFVAAAGAGRVRGALEPRPVVE